MKKNKKTFWLSFMASACFFVSYFVHGGTINLILACAWLCIAIAIGLSKGKI